MCLRSSVDNLGKQEIEMPPMVAHVTHRKLTVCCIHFLCIILWFSLIWECKHSSSLLHLSLCSFLLFGVAYIHIINRIWHLVYTHVWICRISESSQGCGLAVCSVEKNLLNNLLATHSSWTLSPAANISIFASLAPFMPHDNWWLVVWTWINVWPKLSSLLF